MTRLIAVFGAAPGIGKSTMSHAIATAIDPTVRVDLFREEEILSRPAFSVVAEQFRATGVVDSEVLLEASMAFVLDSAAFDVVVTDSLFPFVPSLVAWGHTEDEIRAFLGRLHAVLQPLRPVIVYLDGEPAASLRRAAQRSGDEWLTEFVAKVGTYVTDPKVTDLSGVIAYLQRERDLTVRALRETGWHVVALKDAHLRRPDQLLIEANRRLGVTWGVGGSGGRGRRGS